MSWNASSPVPDGYEVFYQVDGGDILSAGNTTNTMLTIAGVTVAQSITCFVVAYGDSNTIPSARSSVVNVQPGKLAIHESCHCIMSGLVGFLVCLFFA